MLHRYCSQFLAYCQLADFSARSIQALTIRLNELANFLKIQRIRSVKKVRYRHLIDFASDYNAPLNSCHKISCLDPKAILPFFDAPRIIPENIATGIPYPIIKKTVPQFLTPDKYNRLICHFSEQPDSSMGLRNLIIFMLNITINQCFVEALTVWNYNINCFYSLFKI